MMGLLYRICGTAARSPDGDGDGHAAVAEGDGGLGPRDLDCECEESIGSVERDGGSAK